VALNGLIREHWGGGSLKILDVACGIGTQKLGLAALDHAVTASDLPQATVERARPKAAKRGLAMYFVQDEGGPSCLTFALSPYYAVGTGTLSALMEQAGFRDVQRLDDRFDQLVLLGKKA
jgi:hypothetical protein